MSVVATQQATRLIVSDDLCKDIAIKGFLWTGSSRHKNSPAPTRSEPSARPAEKVTRTVPAPGAAPVVDEYAQWQHEQKVNETMTALAIRNAGPRMHTQANWVR